MGTQRSIVHLDADAFFASVEQAADPRLRGKAIAVGGEKRGIIASASYEARKFGVYTPMPSAAARRLCPRLILLPGDFEKYELFSRLMFSYAYDFTPDVEIGSIDEGYFDLTGARKPALDIAQTIRQVIRQALKLPVSEGVGSNKLISQVASKLKKPSALQFVPQGNEAAFLSPLANQWLPGIGPKTSVQLNSAGLARIGQIAHTPVDLLELLVGRMAPQLHNFSLGLDERPVVPARAPAKSYGEQETFEADTTDNEFLEATLRRMADKLMAKVRDDGKSIRTLTVKVRYNDMDEEQASESLPEPTDVEIDLYGKTSALLKRAWSRRVSLRLVSLKLSNVYDGRFFGGLALDNVSRQHAAQQRLSDIVDQLRAKHGRGVLMRGHDFLLRAKHDRGQEPDADRPLEPPPRGGDLKPLRPGARSDRPSCNPKTELSKTSAYKTAVVERQRLANAIALKSSREESRVKVTPGVELRFRINLGAGTASSPLLQPKEPGTGTSPPLSSTSTRPVGTGFIPLNVHSYYSFLDSTLSISAIIELAKRHELPAIAVTDRNNLHGAVAFAQAAAEAGIKPIIGAEIERHGRRAWLYVQDRHGYHNLCQILNRLDSHKKHPLEIGNTALFEATDGLLAVSADVELAPLFPGRFYYGVESPEALEKRPPALPCVATLPVHYHLRSERWKYDIVQSIRTLTLLRQAHPEKRLGGEYHFRGAAEMRRLFGATPGLLERSHEIADRCSFSFDLGKPQFPGFTPPGGSTPAAFLRRLVMEGLQRRYSKDVQRVRPQLEEELAIIMDVGYEEYFLVMWDILQECRRRGIEWITRGSAADSLACYCLGISGVCPIRFDLYFRRFLNKERMALNKLPDIDVDFPHDRKDDVIDLIFEKYGAAHTAVVGGFSTFQARSAFAEAAKVLGVSEFQVRRITERFPHYSNAAELSEAVAETQECRELPLNEEPYATAVRMGQFLDGFPRYPKMHPCGVVLSRQNMEEITPCFTSAKGYPTTHFDMDSVEAVGLIKMDILAQGGLAVMRDVAETLRSPINFDALEPWGDPEVWELIASGNARAVHHIESPAMISLCKMCNVRDIDTLVAIVSVIRPGAANESKKMEFARRYQGLSPVQYPHPSLERCLRSTYGLVVYEEHILQICEAFAGLPGGRADILRRALGKNKASVIAQIEVEFKDSARRLGRTEEESARVWDLVVGFRGYAFCKAHSTAYGVEAYQSAWLKRYYPAEFMAAVLTNGKGFYSPLVYILECHRLGIPLLPPSINCPGPQFTVLPRRTGVPPVPFAPSGRTGAPPVPFASHTSAIRIPVLQVKGLTTRTRESILRERERAPFSSLADFFLRVRPLPDEMEPLIRVGAFDEFGKARTAQYWEFKALASSHFKSQISNLKSPQPSSSHQPWLLPPGNLDRLPAVPLAEPDRLSRLRAEEELLGYCASGHPLELFPDIAWDTYCPIHRLGKHLGEEIVTCGLVIEQRLFHQVTGEPMKFITIADRTGVIETELFARTYRSYGLNTVRYRVLEIVAKVEPFENGRGHTLRVLRAGKPRTRRT